MIYQSSITNKIPLLKGGSKQTRLAANVSRGSPDSPKHTQVTLTDHWATFYKFMIFKGILPAFAQHFPLKSVLQMAAPGVRAIKKAIPISTQLTWCGSLHSITSWRVRVMSIDFVKTDDFRAIISKNHGGPQKSYRLYAQILTFLVIGRRGVRNLSSFGSRCVKRIGSYSKKKNKNPQIFSI